MKISFYYYLHHVLLEWNTYFSNDKTYAFSFFLLASEAYSAFLLKTTIIEIATTSNSPGYSATCIPKLFQKDSCLELKLFKSGIITPFFGSLIYFKSIHALNKVAATRMKEFLQSIFLLSRGGDVPFKKKTQSHEMNSTLHGTNGHKMLQKQIEVLLLYF